MTYDKVYIQKQSKNAPVKELAEEFGIYAKDIPFVIYSAPKELPKNDWKDEDGEEVYVPDGRLPMSAYDMKVEFAYKGAVGTAGEVLAKFFDWLLDGSFKMYNTHTSIGRQNITVKDIDDDAKFYKDASGETVLFKVTFRVSDPVTKIKLVSADGVYNLQ